MQHRLLAVAFGALLTFTAITAVSVATSRLAAQPALAAPVQ